MNAVPCQPASGHRLMDPQSTDKGHDSGYGSQSGVSDEPSGKSTQGSSLGNDGDKGRLMPALRGLGNLREFDQSVNDATLSRFQHIHAQIENPLLSYIRRKRSTKKYRPMAVRLMVLGRSEHVAKPCIVILCPDKQAKTVRKFFNKDTVKTLCRPEDCSLPSFDVFVVGRPLEMKGAEEGVGVSVLRGETETYCGAPITICLPSGAERRCTFGGMLAAVSPNGDTKLYGLTAGHVLLDEDAETDMSGSESEASLDVLEKQHLPWSSRTASEDDTRAAQVAEGVDWDSPDMTTSSRALELTKLGCISKDSWRPKDGQHDAYYDWALIDMLSYKPNRVGPKLSSTNFQHLVAATPGRSGNRQPVLVMTGSKGLKQGSLSHLPSRVLLGHGQEFINAFILNVDSEIVDGDSGSWVVDKKTLQVYGYVVASDAFGGAYVVPMVDALEDIKARLGLSSVRLATSMDITTAEPSQQRDCSITGLEHMSNTHYTGADSPLTVRDKTPLPIDDDWHLDLAGPSSNHVLHHHVGHALRTGAENPVFHSHTAKRPRSPSPLRNSQGKRAPSTKLQFKPAESGEHINCHGEEVPPLLKSTCPEEERFIFESRWRYRHQRGQDMWDSIQGDFAKRFNKHHGREMLQMKFKRARSKYIEWLPRDEDILREAWTRMEHDRYQTLHDLFIEMGGSRNMRLSSSDIEVKVVNDLKLEEHLYMVGHEDVKVRRRRRVSAKKRSTGPCDDMAHGDEVRGVGPLATHNEDDVISQVHDRRGMPWEADFQANILDIWDGHYRDG
ncbi:hypothetical protein G6O67_004519 [Ophiocordyceps sinensis]|uniref:Uncharacterized protein n=2 Tax=Ophiocordyceps sinensis TaxID=72228 RepID=A0A8H4PPK6_9HYPO|nr:hypothetical protein G6O67_004519 [Ophiocordyceps sinensis]